jgi:hypothetical protein
MAKYTASVFDRLENEVYCITVDCTTNNIEDIVLAIYSSLFNKPITSEDVDENEEVYTSFSIVSIFEGELINILPSVEIGGEDEDDGFFEDEEDIVGYC